MYTLFSLPLNKLQPTIKPPIWEFIRRGIQKNISNYKKYYQNTNHSVASQHLLIKILYHFGEGYGQSYRDFYTFLKANYLNYSRSIHLSSPGWVGKAHPGVFYGAGVKEFLIAHHDPIDDFDKAILNWNNLSSVKVLFHHRSDLQLANFTGINTTDTFGYAVCQIDIPLLCLQYKAFRDYQRRFTDVEIDATNSAMQFIRKYVLSNMIDTHMDIAIFNRFYRNYLALPHTKADDRQPFYVMDFEDKVDDVQKEMLRALKDRNYTFSSMLKTILAIDKDSMLEVMPLPNIARTRQIKPALLLARIDVLELLMLINKQSKGNSNQSELNTIRQEIIKYRSDSILTNQLSRQEARNIEEKIELIETLID